MGTATVPTDMAARFAAMTHPDFLDYGELFDGHDGPTCPHCDGYFPHSPGYCSCAGCDACERTRIGVARHEADLAAWKAEHDLRWPPPATTPVPTWVPNTYEAF